MKALHVLVLAPFAISGPLLAAPTSGLSLDEVLRHAAEVDRLLETDLAKRELTPLPVVADDIFVRRAYVGIVGRIPTADEARTFLDNESPDKRTRLIETLAQSPGYDSAAFNYYADLLRLQTTHEQYGLGWHVWLRRSLAEDKPWDRIVNEMLAAEGHAVKNPAVGYYLRDRGMLLDNVSNTVQVFLGHQIGCAQCHDHPFDKWTQMEYYELAAFSGGIRYNSEEARNAMSRVVDTLKKQHPEMSRAVKGKDKRARNQAQSNLYRKASADTRYVFRDFNRNEIADNPTQELKLPDDYKYEDADPGEVVPPATLFGPKVEDVKPEERRQAFADWVTSRENPYFTKVIANRLWDRTFGHGLVDPVDNWSTETVGSHQELLLHLEQIMKEVNYRTRDFERILYHTRLFQREVSPQEATPGVDYHFVGPQLRRLSAEALYDSFTVLTFGNTDDNLNTSLEEKWTEHQHNVLELLDATGPELIKLGAQAKKAEEARREYQQQRREVQQAMAAARKAGDQDKIERLRKREASLRREANQMQSELEVTGTNRYPGRTARASLNMRASEHPAPFRADHLVRQFGGSDRATPEASHTQASVPQALSLLNGQVANSAENQRSEIFQALASIKDPEERLEHLFLSFYATRPTDAEREELLPLAGNRDDLFTLTRAMLTSKRFLFVQ